MPSRRGKILTQLAFCMFTEDCDSSTKLQCKIYITKQQKITLNLDLLKQTWIFPFHFVEFKEFGFLLGLLIRTLYVFNSSVKNRLRDSILMNLSTKKYIFRLFVFRIIMLSLFLDQRGWPFRGFKLLRGPWRFYVLDCNSDQQKCTSPELPDKLARLSTLRGCDSYQTSVPLISLKLSSWQVICNSVCKTNRQFYFHACVRDDVKWKDEADPRGQTGRTGARRSREVG